MINIQGYRELNYSAFQKEMGSYFANSEIKDIEIAVKVGLKSTATVRNAFRTDTQIVSDEVMTKIMKLINIEGFILWVEGNRYYYVK